MLVGSIYRGLLKKMATTVFPDSKNHEKWAKADLEVVTIVCERGSSLLHHLLCNSYHYQTMAWTFSGTF